MSKGHRYFLQIRRELQVQSVEPRQIRNQRYEWPCASLVCLAGYPFNDLRLAPVLSARRAENTEIMLREELPVPAQRSLIATNQRHLLREPRNSEVARVRLNCQHDHNG